MAIGGFKSASVLSGALFAVLAATAFAQSPALVQQDDRQLPPDTQAPPPVATAPAQPQPPAQTAPAQAQTPGAPAPSPASQGFASIASSPLTQKPAESPKVNLQNGLLSIDASNSNLSDVLSAVKRVTGASIEGTTAATERVVVHLGPGRPNEVISALLTGSRYDYVLLGSPQQPGAVTRIMLSVRQGGDQAPPAQAASNVQPPANNSSDEDSAPEDTPEQREQDVRQPEPPANGQPGQPGQPGQQQGQPPQNAQPENSVQPGAQNSEQPKTPQQLFEEIQRMQQQRQQDQSQEDRPQQPPPPQD